MIDTKLNESIKYVCLAWHWDQSRYIVVVDVVPLDVVIIAAKRASDKSDVC